MRLWTIHPRHLDAKGLVAAWREGLLAQKVLRGETRGYTRHPQLTRFQAQPEPVQAIATYLFVLAKGAVTHLIWARFPHRVSRASWSKRGANCFSNGNT